MWVDYQSSYREALQDRSFLHWREIGARQKAANVARVCRGLWFASVLEIGCGTGAVLRELERLKFAESYSAADVSLDAVQFAQQSCLSFLRGALVAKASCLPFRDKAFSLGILSHVIEHLADPAAAVQEASRIAEFVVVEVPTEQVFSNLIRLKVLGRPHISAAEAGHLQFWSPGSIENFLKHDCQMQIVARHRDLLSRDLEFYGKSRLQLAKPFLKEALKTALPGSAYAWLLTTHATFLCCRNGSFRRSGSERREIQEDGVS